MQILGFMKKKSNEEIVEEIILEQYNQYYRLAYSYVHNGADAEDIVQNGAYKALRNSNTLRNPEYAKTWVYRIMLNEIFSFLRQPKPESYEYIQEEVGIETAHVESEVLVTTQECFSLKLSCYQGEASGYVGRYQKIGNTWENKNLRLLLGKIRFISYNKDWYCLP